MLKFPSFASTVAHWLCAALSLLILVGGCSLKPPPSTSAKQSVESPKSLLRSTQGAWVFRHRIRLDIPGQDVPHSFDGIMRFDRARQTAQVVGLGGMGVTLFSLNITPDNMTTVSIHPSLARVPYLREHIAFCIQRIWFDALPALKPAEEGESALASDKMVLTEMLRGVPLTHTFSGGDLMRSETHGKNESWVLTFAEYTDCPQAPDQSSKSSNKNTRRGTKVAQASVTDDAALCVRHPHSIRFENTQARYALTFQLVDVQPETSKEP